MAAKNKSMRLVGQSEQYIASGVGCYNLPALPASCPCPDDDSIKTAPPPKTSMVTNQYICIFESHSSPYLFQEFICSHSSVPHFTPSYNEIVTSI